MTLTIRQKAEMYREYGWRRNRAPYRPLVFCHMTRRFGPSEGRSRPMLAWECRQPGGILWAFGSNRWGRSVPAAPL